MNYTYKINSDKKNIIVRTTGDLETKEFAGMCLEILLKAKELKFKTMFDFRLSKNKILLAEVYFWISTHYDHVDRQLKYIQSAYIANDVDYYFYSFFELTSNNKGIPMKIFLEETPALEWLEIS
jgi:hypothetical protein